jgi:Zn-dependent peptidase ImmA (M78 family)/transcriptional regulator with XRE-family HTH domain
MAQVVNADMLRVARQLRGLQQGEAATQLGLTQATLSRIENKITTTIGDEIIDSAAQVYDLPRSFFYQPDPVLGAPVSVHPLWRKKASVTARDLDVIIAELNIRVMHLRRLLDAVELEATYKIPRLDIEAHEDPEKIAGLVRSQWNMPVGPIQNLTKALEAAGVVVVHSFLGGSAVDGVTFSAPGLPPLIVLNQEQPADRMRFTLAHELGHLVMHRGQPTKEMEDEANLFASAFLMPARDIRGALNRRIDVRLFAELKPIWRVSMQGLLYRAGRLGLLTDNQQRYLWQQFSINRWRTREPVELDFPREPATVLPDLIEAHTKQLGYTIADLSQLLHSNSADLSKLYGISAIEQGKTAHLRIVK